MGHIDPKPYDQRTDLERITSQWTKIHGLMSRKDWSAAVVRAATAAEIAANLAIRREFAERSKFDANLVDHFLIWANGLKGKLYQLLLPMLKGHADYKAVEDLCQLARGINDLRNDVAHRGHFCNEDETRRLIATCETFVHCMVRRYEPAFELKVTSKRAAAA